MIGIDEKIRSLQGDLEKSRQEAEKAQKQAEGCYSPFSCHKANSHRLVMSGEAVHFTLDWIVGIRYFFEKCTEINIVLVE